MAHVKEIAPKLSEGIDRKTLRTIKARFLEVTNGRLERMMASLSGRHQTFIEALPILLHLNHPALPGYVSGETPHGIQGYTPTKDHLHAAHTLARSFRYRKNRIIQPSIQSVYLMGSTGTVAHSENSDMDLWLCYKKGVSGPALAELQEKLDGITHWAEEMGLEVHFFLMEAERFKLGQRGNLSGEDCGSAQHFLLLDEFYRTALLIAGSYPLWWMVPHYDEHHYEEYAGSLIQKRFLPKDESIDFGGISDFPPGEFIGAGMWQLYKGIDSPYKSVLKIVLTEVYASEYPNIEPLSVRYKKLIYSGNLDLDELDPYIMVYRKIENHLIARQDYRRLELIRHCLYFKVNEPLTKKLTIKRKSWRRLLMERLIREWGWDEAYLKQLDNRRHWRVNRVRQERQELVQELNHSYRALSAFARENQIEASIKQEDMNVLGRKLYAAFERKGGKIELVNPGITPDLTEDHLSFHFVKDEEHNGINDYWAVYRDYLKAKDTKGREPIKKGRSVIELIAWCYFNKLIDNATRFSMDAEEHTTDLSDAELHAIVLSFMQLFPQTLLKVPQENFHNAPYPTQFILFLNVGVDPMGEMTRKGIHRLSDHTDSLNYSAMHHNLALSVDQVTINSWGEAICTHYHHDGALMDCLMNYLRQVTPGGKNPLPKIEVRCHCRNRAQAIAVRVEELFSDIIGCYYSGTRPPNTRYLLEIEQHIYMLQFKKNSPVIRTLRNYEELQRLLAEPQPHFSQLVVDKHCLRKHPLSLIAKLNIADQIQTFYHKNERSSQVYISDEKGSVYYFTRPYFDEQSLLAPIHNFLQAVQYRQLTTTENSRASAKPILYYEITGSPGKTELKAERKRIRDLAPKKRYFQIQAIGEYTENNDIFYTIYCADQQFSQFEYGNNLFQAVAGYITAMRSGPEKYPCYITDLDLSQLNSENNGPVQTVEYLLRKGELEHSLNRALAAL
ncbi:MAG: adenylate cyclase [Gammaproteobacteria bacterium]|nr:MAG: adenylate cyclase [Gammaproteobacteria bacterium]